MSKDSYQLPAYVRLASIAKMNIASADMPALIKLLEQAQQAGRDEAAKVAESMSHRNDDMGAIIARRIRGVA